MHADRPEVINHYLLDIDVLESIRIIDKLRFILYSFLI